MSGGTTPSCLCNRVVDDDEVHAATLTRGVVTGSAVPEQRHHASLKATKREARAERVV